MCHFQVTASRKTKEKERKMMSITNDRPSIEPMYHGSGNGGQGSGLGQLPVQSTQEHVPLVFWFNKQWLLNNPENRRERITELTLMGW